MLAPRALFLVPAVAVAAVLGCKTPQTKPVRNDAAAIERVFAADRAAHNDAFGEREDGRIRSAATRTAQYTAALRNISFADVPNEFHYAYMEHIHAWESMQVTLQRKPENGDRAMLAGLGVLAMGHPAVALPTLLGAAQKADQASRQLDREKRAASDQIRATWNNIELLAIKYGANVPKAPAN